MAASTAPPDVEASEFAVRPTQPADAERGDPPKGLRVAFGAAIFSAAFLLFFVELLLGKLILPRFGGTPAVWTACLLVFQLLLLAGYAVAHGLASRVLRPNQGKIMLVTLCGSLLWLAILCKVWPTPITPG